VLGSVMELTDGMSVVAYSLGICGHVTHLRSPPEMRHTTNNSLSLAEWFRETNRRRRCWLTSHATAKGPDTVVCADIHNTFRGLASSSPNDQHRRKKEKKLHQAETRTSADSSLIP